MEYFKDDDGVWWVLDPEYGIPDRVLDADLIAEMDYLDGACPFCGMRHPDEVECFHDSHDEEG